MKKLLFVFVSLMFVSLSFSQQDYQDLLIIKADGSWEKLVKKAEQYTLSGKTKKDPVPYYYMAYGLYKISFDAERSDKFKNAYKDAFTVIGKMITYDKSGEVQSEYLEFVDEMKLSLMELIQNEFDNNDYKRAFGWVMRMYKFGRNYAPVYFLEAASRYHNGDASTARLKWDDGLKLLNDVNVDDFSEADAQILMLGLYESAKVLKENLQKDKAKEMLALGNKYFSDRETWNDYADELK